MNTAQLVEALAASLGSAYPTRVAELANVPGRVTCVIVPSGGQWESGAMCTPVPTTVTAEVSVIAAGTGGQAVADLVAHLDPAADLIRGGGWDPESWAAADVEDRPAIVITATARGDG
jgi:threonine dehydrogenase-like Zn-dependent dehydrogenase